MPMVASFVAVTSLMATPTPTPTLGPELAVPTWLPSPVAAPSLSLLELTVSRPPAVMLNPSGMLALAEEVTRLTPTAAAIPTLPLLVDAEGAEAFEAVLLSEPASVLARFS